MPSARRLTLLVLLAVAAPAVAGAAPRLAPLASAEIDDAQRALTTRFAALGMRNAVAIYARYPALASAMLPYTEFLLTKSTLPPRHRELLWLRTAWLARSDYLWAQRAPAARRVGVTDVELARIALGPDAPGWEPFEAALLRAADELHVDAFVSDSTWGALAARYDANQLTDLVYGVGEIALHAGFASTLRVEIEPELKDRLPSGIAYAPAARQTNARLIGKAARIEPLPSASGAPSANVFRTFARNPPADELRNAVGRHIRDETSLLPRNRQQLIMRVGVLCRSEYEWAAHSRIGRQVGLERRRRRARRRRSVRAGWQSARDRVAARRGRALSRRRRSAMRPGTRSRESCRRSSCSISCSRSAVIAARPTRSTARACSSTRT